MNMFFIFLFFYLVFIVIYSHTHLDFEPISSNFLPISFECAIMQDICEIYSSFHVKSQDNLLKYNIKKHQYNWIIHTDGV